MTPRKVAKGLLWLAGGVVLWAVSFYVILAVVDQFNPGTFACRLVIGISACVWSLIPASASPTNTKLPVVITALPVTLQHVQIVRARQNLHRHPMRLQRLVRGALTRRQPLP